MNEQPEEDDNPTCEYVLEGGHACALPSTWSTDIGGGCSYWCDEHKEALERDDGAAEFFRLS